MKLDYDSIISCPRCGQQVDIMSLRSYNTVSIDYYSDHQIVEENSTQSRLFKNARNADTIIGHISNLIRKAIFITNNWEHFRLLI